MQLTIAMLVVKKYKTLPLVATGLEVSQLSGFEAF